MSIRKIPDKNTSLFVWFKHYAGILTKDPSKTFAADPVDINAKSLESGKVYQVSKRK
jgi:hypothetical protein